MTNSDLKVEFEIDDCCSLKNLNVEIQIGDIDDFVDIEFNIIWKFLERNHNLKIVRNYRVYCLMTWYKFKCIIL